MLQKTTWSGDENVHPAETVAFLLERFSSNNKTGGESMETTNIAQSIKRLNCEFTSWRNDHRTESVHGTPFLEVETFQHWNEESECLSRSSTCRAEKVAAAESRRDGHGLDWRRVEEMTVFQACY